jgi:hypothetical protein
VTAVPSKPTVEVVVDEKKDGESAEEGESSDKKKEVKHTSYSWLT